MKLIEKAEKNQEKQTTDDWIRNGNGKIKPNSPTNGGSFSE